MTSTRTALLIVTDTYTDTTLSRLRAPRHDAAALAEVLGDPEIGGYQVTVLEDEPSYAVRVRIDELFRGSGRDDLILLYVSGHGIKDEAGRLHLATTDTRRALLASTAVPASWVREQIDQSPARKVVVWLDCCYGGAFPAGMVPKAGGTVDVVPQLSDGSGRGCAVMTASTHIQFAFEHGDALSGQTQPSVFTNAIVEGLRTGDADRNSDGKIDANELYGYVYDRVKATTPSQTPTRNDQVTGELYIAHSRRGPRVHPDLPADVARVAEQARSPVDQRPPVPPPPAPPPLVKPQAFLPLPPPAHITPPHTGRPLPRPLVRLLLFFLGSAALTTVAGVLDWATGNQTWSTVIVAVSVVPTGGALGFLLLFGRRYFLDTSATLLTERVTPTTAAFRPDGGLLTCGAGSTFSTWNTFSWSRRILDIRPATRVRSTAFNPNGSVLAIATSFEGITLRNAHTLEPVDHLGRFEADVLVYSPDGVFLAAVGPEQIGIWNTAIGTFVANVSAGTGVRSVAFSPDGRILAVAARTVRLWSTADWREVRRPAGQKGIFRFVAFSPDGTTLLGANHSGDVTMWSTKNWKALWTYHRTNWGPLAYSPDGSLLAAVSGSDIKLRRAMDLSLVRTLTGHQFSVTSLTFSPDGAVLASTSKDGTLKLWEIHD